MKANHDKCHLLVSGKNNVTMNASGFKIKNSGYGNDLQLKLIADWSLKTIYMVSLKKLAIRLMFV